MWKEILQLAAALLAARKLPTRDELVELLLPIAREQIGVALLEAAFAELARRANLAPAPVFIPTLEIATDLGIHHAEHGWFVGENANGPVWDPHPKLADKFRTIGIAEHALVLHGLRGAQGVTIETIPTDEESDEE